jgi:NAD-dependent deacetylase
LPHCERCRAMLRPDIVWFHEMLPEAVWTAAAHSAAACDCFLVAGTTAVVYPAASLVELARATGAPVIEVNLETSAVSHNVEVSLRGKSGQILPRLVEALK